MFYIDHFDESESGNDCEYVKEEHGLIDRSQFNDVIDSEPMLEWDKLHSWWLEEGDILMEYLQKDPFKINLKVSKDIMKQRLIGAKRLGRMNRIKFETELYNNYHEDQLSDNNLWIINKQNKNISR